MGNKSSRGSVSGSKTSPQKPAAPAHDEKTEDGPTTPRSQLSVTVGADDDEEFEVEPGDDWVPFDPRSPRAVKAYVFPWISDDWQKILSEQNFRIFPKIDEVSGIVKRICTFPDNLAEDVTEFLGAADWQALTTDLGRQAPFYKAVLLGTAGVKNDPSRTTYVVIKLWLRWTAQKILSVAYEEALNNVTIKMAGEPHHRRSISVQGGAPGVPLTGEEHLPVALLCVPESTSTWDVSMAARSRRPSMAPGGSRRPSMASNPGSGVLGQGNIGGVLTVPPDLPVAPSSPPSGSPQLGTHSLSQSSITRAHSGSGSGAAGSQTSSPTGASRFTFQQAGSGSTTNSPDRKS